MEFGVDLHIFKPADLYICKVQTPANLNSLLYMHHTKTHFNNRSVLIQCLRTNNLPVNVQYVISLFLFFKL